MLGKVTHGENVLPKFFQRSLSQTHDSLGFQIPKPLFAYDICLPGMKADIFILSRLSLAVLSEYILSVHS